MLQLYAFEIVSEYLKYNPYEYAFIQIDEECSCTRNLPKSGWYKSNQYGYYCPVQHPNYLKIIQTIEKNRGSYCQFKVSTSEIVELEIKLKEGYKKSLTCTCNKLVPFKNGVYDLFRKKFRSVHDGEYIVKFIDYEIGKVPNESLDQMKIYLESLFRESFYVDYFLSLISSVILNRVKKIIVFYGREINENNKLMKLVERTLNCTTQTISQYTFETVNFVHKESVQNPEQLLEILIECSRLISLDYDWGYYGTVFLETNDKKLIDFIENRFPRDEVDILELSCKVGSLSGTEIEYALQPSLLMNLVMPDNLVDN